MHSTTAIIGTKGLATSTQLATGQLLISGYLTRWSELDRQADRMVRGAFARAIPDFLRGHAPLLYAHASRDVLGKVLEMSEEIDHLVVNNAIPRDVQQLAIQQGMVPMREDGLQKAASGETSIEEILRAVG